MDATYNTLPFTHMPPRLVIEMAKAGRLLATLIPKGQWSVRSHESQRDYDWAEARLCTTLQV
jgi:hypothetical protein